MKILFLRTIDQPTQNVKIFPFNCIIFELSNFSMENSINYGYNFRFDDDVNQINELSLEVM